MGLKRLAAIAFLVAACGGDGGGDGDGDGTPDQTFFGGDRPTEARVSDLYDHSQPTPLLVVLHGRGATGNVQLAYTGFGDLLDEMPLIIAAPDGTAQPSDGTSFWNATDACCDFEGTGVDDSGYLSDLVAEISGVYNIDPDRVYLFGHSNGGYMSYRLACDHADQFAALASLAGATFVAPGDCDPSEAVSVLQIHGDDDDTVLYPGVASIYPGAVETASIWAGYDGCGALADTGERLDIERAIDGDETRVERHDGCPAGTAVELWTIETGGHIPALNQAFHQQVWAWLEAQ
jgi:polyhydroxybutyrate depolymerase